LPASTEGEFRWSDATEQNEVYVDNQDRPDLNVNLKTVQEFNDLTIKTVGGVVYLRDVATVIQVDVELGAGQVSAAHELASAAPEK
jgi:multidrug efflux pump subunit AcrB